MVQSDNYKHYEEKRKYPRVEVNSPVLIVCANHQLVEAVIHDISPDGLQIRCNHDVALSINPKRKQIKPEDKVMVNTTFNLSTETGQKKVNVICNIYYFSLLQSGTKNNVAFGLTFKKFDSDCESYIDEFFSEALETEL